MKMKGDQFMKFCTKCGEIIGDETLLCPKCGANIKSDNGSSQSKVIAESNPRPTNSNYIQTMSPVLMFFSIIASLALIVGLILLLIGGIQEYSFRTEYDLSNLSKEGINFVRKFTKYENSINYLTAGGICAGVGLILDLLLLPNVFAVTKKQ